MAAAPKARTKTKTERRATQAIRIEGLEELRDDLRAVDRKLGKELRFELNEKIAEPIAERAQELAAGLGGVHARVAPTIKASSSQSEAMVKGGGAKSPEFFGAEFGALQYPQFPGWKGNDDNAGYMLWPAIREKATDSSEALEEIMDTLLATVIGRQSGGDFSSSTG